MFRLHIPPVIRKHQNGILRAFRYLTVFLIPILVGLWVFQVKQIYPFGENSLLSIDLWGQYFPMYRQFSQSNSLSDMLYSWNGALGFNNFVQSAFYCQSPFLWLLKVIPANYSIVYVDYICILRLGLSALTSLIFLEHRLKSKSPLLMALAISYGLCAYGIAYIMQFMWTDLMVLAPLVLLGVDFLFEKRTPFLYVAALALTVYINFYVAFGVCLFTALYFTAEAAKRLPHDLRRTDCLKALAGVTGRFALYSVLVGILNAVTIIPTLLGLSLSASANTSQVDFTKWYHSFADYINAMLPQTEISLGYGTANVAVGLCVFVLLPLYFFNSSVRYRNKLVSGAFLLVLYSGLNYNPLDYLFNGCHFPNQLPGRWSFLFSLAVILVAAEGLIQLEGITVKHILSSFLAALFFLLIAKYGDITPMKLENLGSWIVWLTVFSLLLCIYAACTAHQKRASLHPKRNKKTVWLRTGSVLTCIALTVMVTAEVSTNTVKVCSEVESGVGTSNMIHYLNATGIFARYGITFDSKEDTFYRTENNEGWTFNDAQLGGYKGIGYYGSTMNGRVYKLLRHMGNRVYTLNISSLYNNSSPVQNSLFGIRYFIDRGKNLDKRLANAQFVAEYEDAVILENPTPLPLGFAASEQIRDYRVTEELQPLHAQNEIINRLCGEEVNVLELRQTTTRSHINCEMTGHDTGVYDSFQAIDSAAPVTIQYTYITEEQAPLYFEHNFRTGNMMLTVGDTETEVFVGNEPFKYVGTYPVGTEVIVTVTLQNVSNGHSGLRFYTLNTDKWQSTYDRLNANGLNVTSFENTVVKGTMTVSDDTTVFTTIPQDNGWSVYVDGKRVNDYLVMGALVGFDLSEGTHDITFRYHVPGLGIGAIVSAAALVMLIGCLIYRRIRKTA